MATVFLEEQTLDFTWNSSNGYYVKGFTFDKLFEVGKKYTVIFDGESFTKEAVEYTASNGTVHVLVGNLSIVNWGDDTGESCVVRTVEKNSYFSIQTKSGTSHTIAVYEYEEATVERTLESISVIYSGGDVSAGSDINSLTGISVMATYSDGSVEEVNGYTLNGNIKAGENTITVIFEDVKTSFVVVGVEVVVLKDRLGKDAFFENVKTVRIPTSDGGFKRFVEENSEEEKESGVILYSATDPEWLDKVVFWDFDGSIVSMLTVEEAKMLSELPTPPEHEGLTFQGWNFTLGEIQATADVLDIGAIYVPIDGKTHVKIQVTSTTTSNRTVPTYFSQTVSNGVTIDWGDGTVETIEGTGVVTTSHVYATTGEYEVTYEVADGCEMTMGGESASYRFIWKNSTSVKVKEIYVGKGVTGIGEYAFYNGTSQNISILTIPNGVKTIDDYAFGNVYNLNCALIPNTVEKVGSYFFSYAGYYTGKDAVLSLPNNVLSFGSFIFYYSTVLRAILPNELKSISNSMFYDANAMRNVILKDKITSIGSSAFQYCLNLKTLELPHSVKTIGTYCFSNTGIESLIIPEGVTSIEQYTFQYSCQLRELILPTTLIAIGNSAFENCRSLRKIIIPENVETVGSSWLEYCTALQSVVISGNKITTANNMSSTKNSVREVVFLQAVPPTAASNLAMTLLGKIYVPDEAVKSYADLISSLSSKCRIRPLSEYIGKKHWE